MISAPVTSAVSLKNLLFLTDLGEASQRAFPFLLAIASRYRSSVTLIHSLGMVPFTPLPIDTPPPATERRAPITLPQLEDLRKLCVAASVPVRVELKDGEVLSVIESELKDHPADLVVLGTHSHGGFFRFFAGSHAEQVIRHTDCPVLMVGKLVTGAARWRDRIARILVATNFEDGSRHALDFIAPIAEDHQSDVTLLHIVDEPIGVPMDVSDLESHASKRKMDGFRRGSPLEHAKIEILPGHPATEIADFANRNDYDLIVLGRRKGSFLAEHKPSTTVLAVAAEARCPVLTIR